MNNSVINPTEEGNRIKWNAGYLETLNRKGVHTAEL